MGSAEERLELDREIRELEEQIRDEEKWKARLEELRVLLSATTESQENDEGEGSK